MKYKDLKIGMTATNGSTVITITKIKYTKTGRISPIADIRHTDDTGKVTIRNSTICNGAKSPEYTSILNWK